MAYWDDGIVDEKIWRAQGLSLLIVCPEPNEEWMVRKHDERRDMRDLLRNPQDPKKRFYRGIREITRAVHDLSHESGHDEVEDHADLVRRIAFIDLKKTGGGGGIRKERVLEATRSNSASLTKQILDINPTHIAVAGKPAQRAFEEHIRRHIGESIKLFKVYHPSYVMSYEAYYKHVQHQVAETGRTSTGSPGLSFCEQVEEVKKEQEPVQQLPRKRAGFWKEAETQAALGLYVEGKVSEEEATARLECGSGDVKWYARIYRRTHNIPKAK